ELAGPRRKRFSDPEKIVDELRVALRVDTFATALQVDRCETSGGQDGEVDATPVLFGNDAALLDPVRRVGIEQQRLFPTPYAKVDVRLRLGHPVLRGRRGRLVLLALDRGAEPGLGDLVDAGASLRGRTAFPFLDWAFLDQTPDVALTG